MPPQKEPQRINSVTKLNLLLLAIILSLFIIFKIQTVYYIHLHFAEAIGYGDPLIAVLPSFHGLSWIMSLCSVDSAVRLTIPDTLIYHFEVSHHPYTGFRLLSNLQLKHVDVDICLHLTANNKNPFNYRTCFFFQPEIRQNIGIYVVLYFGVEWFLLCIGLRKY